MRVELNGGKLNQKNVYNMKGDGHIFGDYNNDFAIIQCEGYLASLKSQHSKSKDEKEKSSLMLCILTTINIIEMLKDED